ncbi:MAG TPA: hypothetical protein VIH29_11965 [Gallionella sp.]
MSTLKDRVIEALEVAKARGHEVVDISNKCNVTVQAVYAWLDPLEPMNWLRAESILGLADLSGFSPWYINDGLGEKILVYAKNEFQKNTLKVMEPMDIRDQARMPKFGRTLTEPSEGTNGNQ